MIGLGSDKNDNPEMPGLASVVLQQSFKPAPPHICFDTLVTCMVLLPFILAVYQNAVEVSTDNLTTSFSSYKRLTTVYVDCPSQ